jgi:hypothetical protein
VAAKCVWNVQIMDAACHASRIRGQNSQAVLTALLEGLDVDLEPTSTAMPGWLPDQAALFGMLTRIRLYGLELIDICRLPHGGRPVNSEHSVPGVASPSGHAGAEPVGE